MTTLHRTCPNRDDSGWKRGAQMDAVHHVVLAAGLIAGLSADIDAVAVMEINGRPAPGPGFTGA